MTTISNSSSTSIEDSVVTAFNTFGLGLTPIWANDNGQEPVTSYVLLTVLNDNAIGNGTESLYVDGSTYYQIKTIPYQMTVRFQFVGKSKVSGQTSVVAANKAKEFETLLRFINARYTFADNGLSLMSVGVLRQIPIQKENNIYTMSGIDLVFGYNHIVTSVVSTIETIDVSGTLQYSLRGEDSFGYGRAYGQSYGESVSSYTLEDIDVLSHISIAP